MIEKLRHRAVNIQKNHGKTMFVREHNVISGFIACLLFSHPVHGAESDIVRKRRGSCSTAGDWEWPVAMLAGRREVITVIIIVMLDSFGQRVVVSEHRRLLTPEAAPFLPCSANKSIIDVNTENCLGTPELSCDAGQ